MLDSTSKAIFWNTWGSRYEKGIHSFLNEHSDADIFCLTEVTDVSERQLLKNGHNLVYSGDEAAAQVNGLAQLRAEFGDKRQVFYNTADYRNWKCINTGAKFSKVGFGSALLVSNEVFIIDLGVQRIEFNSKTIRDRVIQWIVYQKGATRFLVVHLHGVWIKGNTKGDHEARTHQSQETRRLLQSLAIKHNISKVIFGGDLNLDINTKALEILQMGERMGDVVYSNLIYNSGIKNTRTTAYRNYGVEGHSQYADYVFVSKDVHIDSFRCMNDTEASDHAPLIVQFS